MGYDQIGTRMKENYENRTRYFLPRRTYTIIRLDGKAFHTFTKGFKRPFDYNLMRLMDETAIELAKQVQGVKLCYVQSDEISLVLTDFDTDQTEAWFDGNIQKMASVSASIATMAFNKALIEDTAREKHGEIFMPKSFACFDSRVFSIADRTEVFNYLNWRQQDATRNSIQMAAQALYSHQELHGKNGSQLQEMIFQKGINWNDYPTSAKRGRAIVKVSYMSDETEDRNVGGGFGDLSLVISQPVWRTKWVSLTGMDEKPETPIFTQDLQFLKGIIPILESSKE